MRQLNDSLEWFCKWACFAMICAFSGLVFLQVVLRFFSSSLIFVEEFCLILLPWFTFLSTAYAIRKKGHVSVELFVHKLPAAIGKTIYLLVQLTLLFLFVYLVFTGWQLAENLNKAVTTVLGWNRGYYAFSLPFSAAIMVLFVLEEIANQFRTEPAVKGGE